MKRDKTPSSLLWLTFTVELMLVIGSIIGYKLSEIIHEEVHSESYYIEWVS